MNQIHRCIETRIAAHLLTLLASMMSQRCNRLHWPSLVARSRICLQWSHILRARFFPVRFLYCNKKPLTSHDLSLCTVSRLTISMHIHTITFVRNFCIIVHFSAFAFISVEFLARKSDQQCNFKPTTVPQMQPFTPDIQCNMQIVWIRLVRIVISNWKSF